MHQVLTADCREAMAEMRAESIDAIVTDPPYHLTTGKRGGSGPRSLNEDSPAGRARVGTGFMGMAWDGGDVAFTSELWDAALRVAKPGAHLLAFGGTRTFHRLAVAIEDAGWEIRDCLSWLYGQGFPKSLNLGDGLGTALKPAWEPVILARKPVVGTVAENLAANGCGALNIDQCRIPIEGESGYWPADHEGASQGVPGYGGGFTTGGKQNDRGRWPANVVLDPAAAAELDAQTGELASGALLTHHRRSGDSRIGTFEIRDRTGEPCDFGGDSGGASRFFYCAKPDTAEKENGLDGFDSRQRDEGRQADLPGGNNPRNRGASPRRNHHPTVKPVELMQWLVRLVTPAGGVVLDPFCGSGSTGIAALREGRGFIGVDLDPDYAAIARRRIEEDAPLFNRAGAEALEPIEASEQRPAGAS